MTLSVYTLKDISTSQERLCHLLSKNYKSACAICWENIILHSHPEIEISFKFIPKILMSKGCIHFCGPLCIVFSSALLPRSSLAQICSSALSSIVSPWMWRTKFYTHIKTTDRIVVLGILTFTLLDSKLEDEKTPDRKVAGIPSFQSAVNFLVGANTLYVFSVAAQQQPPPAPFLRLI